VSPDGKTYTFHLRENLLSQAGDPLTADDVLWSFERKFASPTGNASAYAPAFTNPKTQLRNSTNTPWRSPSPRPGTDSPSWACCQPERSHLRQHVPQTTRRARRPICDQLEQDSFRLGFRRLLDQVGDAGAGDGPVCQPHFVFGEPSIKTITLRVVPDAGTRASLLIRGDVDLAESIRPIDQKPLAAVPGVTVPR